MTIAHMSGHIPDSICFIKILETVVQIQAKWIDNVRSAISKDRRTKKRTEERWNVTCWP